MPAWETQWRLYWKIKDRKSLLTDAQNMGTSGLPFKHHRYIVKQVNITF